MNLDFLGGGGAMMFCFPRKSIFAGVKKRVSSYNTPVKFDG